MTEIIFGIIAFTLIVLLLTLVVLGARRLLVPSGECVIRVNQKLTLNASIGQRLLDVLSPAGIDLPTACGGVGTCGLCKLRITHGGGEAGPQEIALLSRKEARRGARLACQVSVMEAMDVEVDDVYFGVQSWSCRVENVRQLSTLISEIVLRLPEQESCEFRPGSFVQLSCPPYQLKFSELEIDPLFRPQWDKDGLWSHSVSSGTAVTRAYSTANRPGDNNVVRLNVRIALPPPHSHNIPPGVVSSWLFSLKPGDMVELAGPYGLFFVEKSEREAIFIGGGVGMAPLYAQVLDLLKTQHSNRKISYWYGARSKRELYYGDEFEQLAAEFENFDWRVVLSEPERSDNWQGRTGFIHKVIYDEYLAEHPVPEDCEYDLCGPPLMIKAVLAMLDNLGVDADSIHYDDFGGG
ncbi:MAG: NADH:ubiquinone reductase (Na(+)-transporting) subunit F [Gammaproteobacteria bacterium]|nr:NADH:ubiquinone reductase (Na(+)-transporting) subunit F [Gammaproteobacteria bacterium]